MLDNFGQFSVRHRCIIIIFWITAVVLITILAPDLRRVSFSDQTGYLNENAPSLVGMKMFKKYFPDQVSASSAVLVFSKNSGGIKDTTTMQFLSDFTIWVKSDLDKEVIGSVYSPVDSRLAEKLISSDGRVGLIFIGIKGSYEDIGVVDTLSILRNRMKTLPFELTGYVTGAIPITNAYRDSTVESAEKTTIITVILVVLILLMIYRSPVLPLVSLITIGTSYGIARGLSACLAVRGMPISSMTDLFLVVLLFGAGTDYCLFIISRYREFMADGIPASSAAALSIAKTAETIISSAGTVIVGVMAVCFVSLKIFSNTGPSLELGLIITLAAVLTLAPALLSILGPFAFWPGKPTHAVESIRWGKLADLVTRRPLVPLSLGMIILVPLAVYGLFHETSFDMLADLPENNMAKAGFNIISRSFGAGQAQPVDLMITGINDAREPSGIARIDSMTRQLSDIEGVADVASLTRPMGRSAEMQQNPLRVETQLGMISSALDNSIRILAGESGIDTRSITVSGNMFSGLRFYMAGLASAFPSLERNADYQAAMKSLMRIDGILVETVERLRLTFQLDGINTRMKIIPDDAVAMLKQLRELRIYLEALPLSVPDAEGVDGYVSARADLDAILVILEDLEKRSAAVRTLGLISRQTELQNLHANLAASLLHMKNDAEARMPAILFIPPPSIRGEQANTSAMRNEIIYLRESVRGMILFFSSCKGSYYNPLQLVKGTQREDLELLLNTYTTPSGDAERYQIILADEPYSSRAMDTVLRLKRFTENLATYQSGATAVLSDLRDAMKHDTILLWILVSAGIMLVLVLLLRSLVAPVYLMLTIVLSYNATMGITRILFEVILDKSLTWFVPFFMFVLLMALGMDYNIFLMGRVKEETSSGDIKAGVRRAVSRTGSIITSAGIIMAGTFAAMMSSSLWGLVQLGFAVTAGVLLDTFIIRTTLVPAIVVLLGRWNWWPFIKSSR